MSIHDQTPARGGRSPRRAARPSRLLTTAVVGAVVCAGAGTTLALWRSSAGVDGLGLTGARHTFVVHPADDTGMLPLDGTSTDSLGLVLSGETVKGAFGDGDVAYLPFDVDGWTEGGAGMSYRIAGVEGGDVLASDATHARLWNGSCPADGTPPGDPGDRVYDGPLSGLGTQDAALLVAPGRPGGGAASGQHHYCLELRIAAVPFESTATVTGKAPAGLDPSAPAASDSWSASFVPDIAGESVTITFDRWPHR